MKDMPQMNNYALHVLSGNDHTAAGLERAKALAARFTYILDQACPRTVRIVTERPRARRDAVAGGSRRGRDAQPSAASP